MSSGTPVAADSAKLDLDALRDVAFRVAGEDCEHVAPCLCRRRTALRFIGVAVTLRDAGWTIAGPS